MNSDIYGYIFVMAVVTYLIRALPLVLIRGQIENNFIRSFLHYVPYVTLALMVFPAVFHSTAHTGSAVAGTAAAVILAMRGGNLIQVVLLACAVVFAYEFVVF